MRKWKCLKTDGCSEKYVNVGDIFTTDDNGCNFKWNDGSKSGYPINEYEEIGYKFEEIKEDEKVREFKVGDMVRVVNDNWDVGLQGKIGTIVDLGNEHFEGGIGIEFEDFKDGHECSGYAKSSQGWWYKVENIELVLSPNNQKSIHITTDGTTTHVVLKDGKDVIKRAKVGLYHEDEYKFETGVMEVVKKLFDIKEESKPFIKAKVGDRIRIVNSNNEHYPEVNNGDIHKVKSIKSNGITTDAENLFYDYDKEYEIIESTKDLSDYTTDELLSEIRIRSVR